MSKRFEWTDRPPPLSLQNQIKFCSDYLMNGTELFACIAINKCIHFCSILNFPRTFGVIFVFQKLTILLENKQTMVRFFTSSHFSARKCKLWPSPPCYFETFNQVFPPTNFFELICSKHLISDRGFDVLREAFTHTSPNK